MGQLQKTENICSSDLVLCPYLSMKSMAVFMTVSFNLHFNKKQYINYL